MKAVKGSSIDLVVTSPPYPMIEMWDGVFSDADSKIRAALSANDGNRAFELMHRELDGVWDEVVRVLKTGGFACINIGDATRTVRDEFRLYPNHSRILTYLYDKGLSPLPAIIWRKQTNAPNKFMGSGVLPAGAYVTLEHEYVLILRKGKKRTFDTEKDRAHRQESALFWEERNQWFSDVWFDLKGARQDLADKETRKRSGAFPFELPYRLINMYSVKGDTVLDPFMGLGTTLLAAMAAGRNFVGFEIDRNLKGVIETQISAVTDFANGYINERLKRHQAFVEERIQNDKPLKHRNVHYGFPVIMNQEKNLKLDFLKSVQKKTADCFEVEYTDQPVLSAGSIQEPEGGTAGTRQVQLEFKF